MKVLTWNINGIRAVKGKTTKQLLDSLGADIICLQETKVTRDMLDEPTAIVEGYESYFSFSRKRTGYSGTANYCNTKTIPVKAEEGLTGRLSSKIENTVRCYGATDEYSDADLDDLDAEGRCVITQHKIRLGDDDVREVAVVNVYVPRAGDREDRLQYKLKFLNLLQCRAEALLRNKIHVIILGDLNLTHRKLDNCDPGSCDYLQRSSRLWMNRMLRKSEQETSLPSHDGNLAEISLSRLEGGHFSDVYRFLHPQQENAFTNWSTSTDARKNNYGKRLDYFLVDTELAEYVESCSILAEVEGSDHCPVLLTLTCKAIPATVSPALCSKNMPEFKGQQQKLSSFFTKSVKKEVKNDDSQEVVSLSSSPEDFSSSPTSSLKKSSSLPSTPPVAKPTLNKTSADDLKICNASESKNSLKRGASASDKKTNKKAKLKQEDTKQKSLTSFFSKVPGKDSVLKNSSKTSESEEGVAQVKKDINKTTSGEASIKSSDTIMDSQSSGDSDVISVTETCVSSQSSKITLLQCSDATISDHVSFEEQKSQRITTSSSHSLTGNSTITGSTSTKSVIQSTPVTGTASSQAWKSLLKGPDPPPLCPGHKEPCVLKTVNKKGPNKNRKFYVCARPEGAPNNPEARCNYFRWFDERKKKT